MYEGDRSFRIHWRTALTLALIFFIALFFRFYFVWELGFTNLGLTCTGDAPLPVSGGSDSFYWHRALCYSFETGKDLDIDALLNYGGGLHNPRPPLFPWFALLMGYVLSPLFAHPWHAILFVFLASTGLFGALTIFPTYLLTKEAFGRRAGLVAAFLLAVSSAHMQRSQATDADHDAWTLFFVVSTFYFFLRALKVLQPRRWVDNWFTAPSIVGGLRTFFRDNRASVLYAVLAGLCVTVIALSWQGWAYVPVILLVYFGVQLFLDRVRNQDPLGLTILFMITGALPMILASPWYYSHNQIRVWFDVPAYLFLVAVVLGIAFTVTRDYPWTLVIPATLVAGGAGLGVGILVNPALANAFLSGAGYFVQTKVYETIAEAQAPGLSQLILSFGFFTFYFSLAAVAYMLWQIPRRREASYAVIVIWAFAAIFMAIGAARFIFNASPAFAVTAAFATDQIIHRADFAGMRRTYRSLVQGSWRNAVRKSVKLRHILTVLVLVGVVLLPNVWWGIDASIPFEFKARYDRQVHELLPSFLQAPGYGQVGGRTTFYFGAFGYAIPQEAEYFPAAWRWFRSQDADRPPEQRPAFLSWWDYGFEAVDRGQHPTVADNFQNGFAFAGQFITAQNETQAIALLAIRLLESEVRRNGGKFSPATERVLESFGFPVADFRTAIVRPGDLIRVVQANPQVFGVWDSEIQALNALYIFLTRQLLDRLDATTVVDFYRDVRRSTGQEIGYFAVDARLFPISATNTGIFYAPVKLSDHRVVELPDGRTLPTEFFQIFADTDRQTRLPIQDVGPGDQVQSQTIEYQPKFYNSMFYRAYVGYSPRDLGSQDRGIPGFSQALAANPPEPAWNLSHFRTVYRTAYYNPFADPANHTDAWRAVNFDEAQRLQQKIQAGRATGVVDLSTQSTVANGVVFLRYYDGAIVNGTVRAGGTTPLPGVRVTVADELGTPHYVTTTDASGRFSVIAPFGNVTLTASVGAVIPRALAGGQVLASTTFPVSLGQAMREDIDADGDGRADWLRTEDLDVSGRALDGTAFFDLDRDGFLGPGEPPAPNATIELFHRDVRARWTATADREGAFAFPTLPLGGFTVNVSLSGRTVQAEDITLAAGGAGQDVAVPFAALLGSARSADGTAVAEASVEVLDEAAGTAVQTRADATGAYSVGPLLPGNYTVSAAAGDLASVPVRVRATTGEIPIDLTLVPSGRVAGTTRLFGVDQPFATLEFQPTTDVQMVRRVTADGSGRFRVVLPAGDWNVHGRLYVGDALYATLGRVSVRAGEETTHAATFVTGARLEGRVNGTSLEGSTFRANLAFLGDTGDWWIQTSAGGGFLTFLPRGSYGIQAFTTNSVFHGNLTLPGDRRAYFPLAGGTSAVARVYRDLDADNAYSPGEEIAGATIRLRDDWGRKVLAVTNATGIFQIMGFANRTYVGAIEGRGFEPFPIDGSLSKIRTTAPFALTPVRVEVRGAVLLDGAPLRNRPVTVQAVAIGDGARTETATTDSNGGFFLDLSPGAYELVVDENVSGMREWRYQNLAPDPIVVPIGAASVMRDLAVVARALVQGNVTLDGADVETTVRFEGPDVRSATATASGYEVYLRPGNYSVSASASRPPDEFGILDARSIPGPGRLDLALTRAAVVAGFALFNNVAVSQSMPVTFARREGGTATQQTRGDGSYTALLVPGTYDVALDFAGTEQEGRITRFYRYTFQDALSVPADATTLTFHLNVDRTFDNTTVTGVVRRSGVGVDAALVFFARDGGAVEARTTASPTGAYSIGLAPGTYDVYATRTVGSGAFLHSMTVPHAETLAFDIPLRDGFTLSGVVTDPLGRRTDASLVIQAGSRVELTADATGAYDVLLPAGPYAITASRSGTERGVPVEYRTTTSVDLQMSRVVNLPLEKVVRRSVALTWDVGQRQSVAQGGSAVYTIQVRNAGNVADTYRFSGRPGDWTFAFVPSSVDLNFGNAGNGTTVSVTITAPKDAIVAHGPITAVATSSDGVTQGTVAVEVNILRTRSLSVRVDLASGTFDGRFLNYTVEVKNTGNDPETVTVFLANPDDLAASGWTARLFAEGSTPSGTQVKDLAVNANSTVRLRLRLDSARGPGAVGVVLQAFAQDAPSVAATHVQLLRLPELSAPAGAQATGPNVAREPSINPLFLTIAIAVAAAVAAGFVLTRRRR